jgi:peptidyl-tRNA hydrolase, PTH2 family
MKSKQVIVMRKSFEIEGKKITPRKGKYIAQGAHASMKALLDCGYKVLLKDKFVINYQDNSALKDWLEGSFTKVCCVVETEKEITDLYEKAKEKGLPCSLITDSGLTEFNNIPTITCCAIGPAWENELDEITGHLGLF